MNPIPTAPPLPSAPHPRTTAILALGLALCLGGVLGCRPAPPGPGASSSKLSDAMNRGVSLMGQYNYAEAAAAFEQAVQLAPDLADARVNLAIALFNRSQKADNDIVRAGELVEEVLRREPDHLRALYFKGIVHQHLGQPDTAIACFERVAKARPHDGAVWYLLGLCRHRLGQNAEQDLRRAIESRPYLSSAYYLLWQTLRASDQDEKAAPQLETFKALRDNPLAETIEIPQYNQMGDLALAVPLPATHAASKQASTVSWKKPAALFEATDLTGSAGRAPSAAPTAPPPDAAAPRLGGFAAGDVDRDGRMDLLCAAADTGAQTRLCLLRQTVPGRFADTKAAAGLASVSSPVAMAFGDYNNDEALDLFVAADQGGGLFRGGGDGAFTNVSRACGLPDTFAGIRCVLFADADHDGDLDLVLGCTTSPGLQLWNNNADGSFSNLTVSAGLADPTLKPVACLPGDLDGDRDFDLVVLQAGLPVRVFLNDLLTRYHPADTGIAAIGDQGGVLQDFDGDGRLDLILLGGSPAALEFHRGDGHAQFQRVDAFAPVAQAVLATGLPRGLRAADLDLDGDLDLAVFTAEGHALLNDGTGQFTLLARTWPGVADPAGVGVECFDVNQDFIPDLLTWESGTRQRLVLAAGHVSPPPTAIAVSPTGTRGRDKRTRSPANGFGTRLTVRSGDREHGTLYTGQSGGPSQSALPVVLGLAGHPQADYILVSWPDAVAQVEQAIPTGQRLSVAEVQRKISSCPVLFTWNGAAFECVTDFAGVGGLGYFVGAGEYAMPQPLEHIKIEPAQLQPQEGVYELRLSEPMEESAYIDRLELRVIHQPAGWRVYPDERLVVTGPAPTRDLLVVDQPIRPRRALDPQGRDCTERLARADRRYAYSPELDRRFFGFSRAHTLELDFGDALTRAPRGRRLFLFLEGYLEYPYSQTAYAASQARVAWEPLRIDRARPDGTWQTIVPDAGAFGGMGRMITADLTGKAEGPGCRLRLTTNLELYYDEVFLGWDLGGNSVQTASLPLIDATLRRVGFAREVSPDGAQPFLYDYAQSDPTAPFHVLRGAYTRFGPVRDLLAHFDDQYVIFGPGEEIVLRFDASRLPPPPPGNVRSFVLVSHAWCKDMDLYTATPRTLEPLPFRGMSRYPYPPGERYPDTPETRQATATYQTRVVE